MSTEENTMTTENNTELQGDDALAGGQLWAPHEVATLPPPESNDSPEESSSPDEETEPEVFPAKVVKDLRKENARYRERAQKADDLAQRLHTALVAGTGKLADPTDLEFDEAHLEDPEALAAAVDDLLARKPHLRARRVAGDVGQGNRGKTGNGPDLLEAMRGTL